MLGTIVIGSCVSVQGDIVRRFADGRLSVMVGDQVFTGKPANPGEVPQLRAVPRMELIRTVA
jgi:hypothetical protein